MRKDSYVSIHQEDSRITFSVCDYVVHGVTACPLSGLANRLDAQCCGESHGDKVSHSLCLRDTKIP